ncbi:MAG: tetratricopeptide repeat protein [Calothrix sp. MO_167.B42]|nr:tetratricopeptide repeat protein [Calothrix sp. MO_167.B42]
MVIEEDSNQDAYDDLIVTIEGKVGKLEVIIAVCDDLNFRDSIVEQYEAELQPRFHTYRIKLAKEEPSLTAAINQLVEQEEYLRQYQPAVITVTGTEQLFSLKLGNEQSEQDKFFGYLQWTREALREFPYAIILWVTNQILVDLTRKSPDFWGWREGVFRFVSHRKITVSHKDIQPIRFAFQGEDLISRDEDNDYFLPIQDLQELIKRTEEQRGVKDANLATLYSRLANIYKKRLDRGEAQDYLQEQELAIEYYQKAVALQTELGLEVDLATSLNNLAYLYYSQGMYSEAEPLYQHALQMGKQLLGESHTDVATNLNNLALLYDSQGRYSEAEPLYQQALQMRKRLLGESHTDVATSLNNLAGLYYSQGKYSEAEPLFQQALQMTKRLLGEENPDVASSLSNLASLYKSQGRYSEAESLYRQALLMNKRVLGESHPNVVASLNNLAVLYYSQGMYSEAEPLVQQALQMGKRVLGESHPNVAASLNNLASLYKSQGKYSEAEPLYQKALEICERVLGANHPDTVTVRKNIEAHAEAQRRREEEEEVF